MNTFAKFQIIGNVGKVEIEDNRIRISVANNVSYKDRENEGQYIEKTEWNEVTMFEGMLYIAIGRNVILKKGISDI